MPKQLEWTPRLSIVITEEHYLGLQKLVPWGTKRELFAVLIDGLLASIEENGDVIIGALLNNKIKFVPVPVTEKEEKLV